MAVRTTIHSFSLAWAVATAAHSRSTTFAKRVLNTTRPEGRCVVEDLWARLGTLSRKLLFRSLVRLFYIKTSMCRP